MEDSIGELKEKYENLIKRVENDDYYKIDLTNRVNIYVCLRCGMITKTKDVDPGVTPFMIGCPICNGDAHSNFYNDTAPHLEPSHKWYRPRFDEFFKLNKYEKEHVLKGGLLLTQI